MTAYDPSKPFDDMTEGERNELLARLKRKAKFCMEAGRRQREREREDTRFQVAENQWEPGVRQAREGRPTLAISLTRQPLQLINNQAANSKLGVSLHPKGGADDDSAKVVHGLYRHIERDGRADQARMWAVKRASLVGIGWYRVMVQYDESSANPSDQEIVFERIFDQSTVYYDPTAQRPDFSDAKVWFVAAHMLPDDFGTEYPHAKFTDSEDFAGLKTTEPEWVRAQSGGQHAPLVVEMFYVETTQEDAEILHEGKPIYSRKREKRTVCRAVFTARELLDKTIWAGHYIPAVPVIYEELQPIDGERVWEGIVRPARGAQEAFNFGISSMVEDASRLSKAPYVGPAGAFRGFEDDWKDSNIKNIPFLQYQPIDAAGKPAAPPAPMQIDGTKMQLSLALAQEAKDLAQTATSVPAASLGEMPKRRDARSGRAILALQQQSDASTSHVIQNLATISMPLEVRIVLDLAPAVYDRPGRAVEIISGDDKTKRVVLNAPYVEGPAGPQPIDLQEGAPLPDGTKVYDLAKGAYSIETSIGKSHQTQMQEGLDILGEIIASSPDLFPILGDLLIEMKQIPKGDEMAKRIRAYRERLPGMQGLGDDGTGKLTPEQAQVKVQALEGQIQAMQQQLQQAAQALEMEQAKHQATLQKSQMDNESRERIAAQNNETKLLIAQMQARLDAMQAALDRRHEAEAQDKDMAHDVAMGAAGGHHMAMSREGGREDEHGREDETTDGRSASSSAGGDGAGA